MKVIKEYTEFTDEEIMETMRIACEDWENILDGAIAVWGHDILNPKNWKEQIG